MSLSGRKIRSLALTLCGLAGLIIAGEKFLVLNSYDVSFMNESFKTLKRLDDITERRLASISKSHLKMDPAKVEIKQSYAIEGKAQEYTGEALVQENNDIQIFKLTSIFDMKRFGKILDNRDESAAENKFSGEVSIVNEKLQALSFEVPEISGKVFTGSTQRIVLENIIELDDGVSVRYSFDGSEYHTGIVTKSTDEISITFSQSGPYSGMKLVFCTDVKLERDSNVEFHNKIGAAVIESPEEQIQSTDEKKSAAEEVEQTIVEAEEKGPEAVDQVNQLDERAQLEQSSENPEAATVLPRSYDFSKNTVEQNNSQEQALEQAPENNS